MECAEVLWTQRAQHKTGDLSSHGAKKSRNPHIKSSRDLIENSSRDSHKLSENLVEIYHHSHKVQSRLSASFIISISYQNTESSRDTRIIISSSRDVCIPTYTLHLVEIHAIICTYTSRYIMHKRVYTVTLDIECWDDLKVDKIDWARSINLFPDEFIHSSVQEHPLPRLVDRT